MLNTKEWQELTFQFEKDCHGEGNFAKEPKNLWSKGVVYQDGHINKFFLMYSKGYSYGKTAERLELFY